MRKLLIGAALAALALAVLPLAVWLIAVALAVGAYALFGMKDGAAPATFTHDPGPEPLPPLPPLPDDERYIPPAAVPLPVWHAPLQSIMQRLAPWCADAIAKIGLKTFDADPILTPEQTRLAGIINSATRAHGLMIEKAILECLQDREDRPAWCEPAFRLSHGDTNYHKAATAEGIAFASLPYGDGDASHRAVQVDLITFDKASGIVRGYEIKRNHLDTGSAANLQIVRSLLCSYAQTVKQLPATSAEMFTIAYYSAPHKGVLTRADLDQHFGCPVVANVEKATAEYRADLQAVLGTADAADRTKAAA
jgi:hypothetical protein